MCVNASIFHEEKKEWRSSFNGNVHVLFVNFLLRFIYIQSYVVAFYVRVYMDW